MSLQSRVLKAFKTISEKEGVKVDNPSVILIEKDPTQAISIDFEKGIIEFNPKCLKQPTFEKMIKKGGLDRFLEYSMLIEVLKHKIEDRQKNPVEVVSRYPEYVERVPTDMIDVQVVCFKQAPLSRSLSKHSRPPTANVGLLYNRNQPNATFRPGF